MGQCTCHACQWAELLDSLCHVHALLSCTLLNLPVVVVVLIQGIVSYILSYFLIHIYNFQDALHPKASRYKSCILFSYAT